MTTKFQVGKTYYTRMIGDSNLRVTAEVISRTAKTIRARVDGESEVKTFRVSEYRDVEQVKPYGSYSMAPIVSADKEFTADVKSTAQLEDDANAEALRQQRAMPRRIRLV